MVVDVDAIPMGSSSVDSGVYEHVYGQSSGSLSDTFNIGSGSGTYTVTGTVSLDGDAELVTPVNATFTVTRAPTQVSINRVVVGLLVGGEPHERHRDQASTTQDTCSAPSTLQSMRHRSPTANPGNGVGAHPRVSRDGASLDQSQSGTWEGCPRGQRPGCRDPSHRRQRMLLNGREAPSL